MESLFKNSINSGILRVISCTRFVYQKANVKYPPIKPKKSASAQLREKMAHPYRKIHPWKSRQQFIDSVTDQILYNHDGLVAINKPYGISARARPPDQVRKYNLPSGIVNEVNYLITDVIPQLCRKLDYQFLEIIKTPERFTSGVLLLGATNKIKQAVEQSLRRAQGERIIPRTYWTVCRRVPSHPQGEKRLGMHLLPHPDGERKEVEIITKWSQNQRARQDIKVLNVQFKILSTSTLNVASLVEMKISTAQWHAIRLFASTVLLSPILGDQIFGSRARDILGTFLKVSPFADAAKEPPKLDSALLRLLRLTHGLHTMIPAHVHLREMYLPCFLGGDSDIVITAPLQPEFMWTCKQLYFEEEVYKPQPNVNSHSHGFKDSFANQSKDNNANEVNKFNPNIDTETTHTSNYEQCTAVT